MTLPGEVWQARGDESARILLLDRPESLPAGKLDAVYMRVVRGLARTSKHANAGREIIHTRGDETWMLRCRALSQLLRCRKRMYLPKLLLNVPAPLLSLQGSRVDDKPLIGCVCYAMVIRY